MGWELWPPGGCTNCGCGSTGGTTHILPGGCPCSIPDTVTFATTDASGNPIPNGSATGIINNDTLEYRTTKPTYLTTSPAPFLPAYFSKNLFLYSPGTQQGSFVMFYCESFFSTGTYKSALYFVQNGTIQGTPGTQSWPLGGSIASGLYGSCSPFLLYRRDTDPASPTYGSTTTFS